MDSLILSKKDFNDDICCTGEQLAFVIRSIFNENNTLKWYSFDLIFSSLVGEEKLFGKVENGIILKMDDMERIINRISNVIQFESGVFIAFFNNINPVWDFNNLPETEEEEKLQHIEALIEIRLFDFTSIEIYTREKKYIDIIKLRVKELSASTES